MGTRPSEPPPDADSPAFQLARARERLEIVDALAAAIDRREEVIAVAVAAPDPDAAREDVMRLLGVGHGAATAILDVQIRRLTVEQRRRIVEEQDELRRIIGDPERPGGG